MCKNMDYLIAAGADNYFAVEELLLNPDVDPAYKNSLAFIYACKGKDISLISLILHNPKINVSAQNNQAFIEAANRMTKYGIKIIDFLMTNIKIRENITEDTYKEIIKPNVSRYIRDKLLISKLRNF